MLLFFITLQSTYNACPKLLDLLYRVQWDKCSTASDAGATCSRIDQIPAELIKEGGRTIRYQIHKLTVSIWNKEELPEEWKESIIVPIHKKGDKTDCNNYRGISLLPATYKILSNILLSRLTPYAEEIIGDHQCGFRRNTSTTDHLFCIRQMLEKKCGIQ